MSIQFQDDFSSDLSKWTQKTGTWGISNGKLSITTGVGTNWSTIVSNSSIFNRMKLTFNATGTSTSNSPTVVLRWSSSTSNVYYQFGASAIYRYINGSTDSTVNYPHSYGNTNINVEITVINNIATIKINGNTITTDDLTSIPNGIFGFATYNGQSVSYDNVVLDDLAVNKTLILLNDGSYKYYNNTIKSLVVPMNANDSNGQTVTSSSVGSSYYPYLAFNGIKKGGSPDAWSVNSTLSKVGWIEMDFSAPSKIDRYAITSYDYSSSNDYAPKTWTLSGWDGSQWINLDTRTSQINWTQAETRTFDITQNFGSYRKLKLDVTEISGANSYLVIGEIEYFEVNNSWQTVTSITPTKADFDSSGMTDLSTITQDQWTTLAQQSSSIQVVTYVPTGNTSKNYRETYDDLSRFIEMTGLPIGQTVIPVSDIQLYGSLKNILVSKLDDGLDEAIIRTLVSFNSGTTWESYKNNAWSTVSLSDITAFVNNGMTIADLANVPQSEYDFKAIRKTMRIAYYIEEDVREWESEKIDKVLFSQSASLSTPTISDSSLYILNTQSTISMTLNGNIISGGISDIDSGKVQYRIVLNGNYYYPTDGSFTNLQPSPANINIRLRENSYRIDQPNTLRVEFQDYWGKSDFWETTFIGTYYGLIFTDETGNKYSTDIGQILKYLDVGTLIAGQTSTEFEIHLANQYGYDVANPTIYSSTENSMVDIQISKSLSPFDPQSQLSWNQTLTNGDSLIFYMRLTTQLTTPPTSNGNFQLRVNADKL